MARRNVKSRTRKKSVKKYRSTNKWKRRKAPQATTAVAKVGYSSGFRIYPKQFIAIMRYKVPFTLVAPTVDTWNNSHFFCATSPFDPDTTGVGGTTATLFAQLAAQYNHFNVISSRMTFTGTLRAGNSMICSLSSTDDTIITHATVQSRLQDTDTVTRRCDNEKPNFVIRKSYSRSKVFGKGSLANLQGGTASNPAENHFFCLASTNLGFGLAPSIIDGVVDIVYRVRWSEMREDPNI